jgi:hypothetical protein
MMIDGVNWIRLAQEEKVYWRAFVYTAVNLRVS